MRTRDTRAPLPAGAWALFAVFALNGLMFAAWFPYVATVGQILGLEKSSLGLALFGLPAGLLMGVVISQRMIVRWDARTTIAIGLLIYCAGMALPGLAWGQASLFVALLIPGFGNGVLDPAMHLEVNRFEHATGTQLQGYSTGIFSTGQVVASLLAPLALAAHVPPRLFLPGVAALGVLVATGVCWQLRRAASLPGVEQERSTRGGRRWRRRVAGLAVVAVAGFVTDGVWADWHGVFMVGDAGASLALAAFGFTAYQIASVASRFLYGPIVNRIGRFAVLLAAAAIALVGGLVVVTATTPAAGLIGAAVLGFGAGPVVPLAISACGRDERAVTYVTLCGYFALTAAPPAIGFLAEAVTLRTALWVLVGTAVVALVASKGLKREAPSAD